VLSGAATWRRTDRPLFHLATERPEVHTNVGGSDRIARAVVGVALLLAGWWLHRSEGRERRRRLLSTGLAYAGAELLVTAVIQRCPVNALLGVNTCEQRVPEAARSARARLSRDDGGDRCVPIPTRS